MKTRSLVLIVIGVIVLVSLLAVWLYPSLGDFRQANSSWNGINRFSTASGATILRSLDNLPAGSQNTVLISIPAEPLSPESLSTVKSFVASGGTLIIFDHFGFGNDILSSLGLSVRFDRAQLLDTLFCLKNPNLPKITDFSSPLAAAGIKGIILDHPTVLDNVDQNHALAWSSSYSSLDSNDNSVRDAGEPAGPFVVAAAYPVGNGTVDIVSDPGLIINALLGQNDNYAFVRYLTSGTGGQARIMIDGEHFTQTPLDIAKVRMDGARTAVSSPFILAGIVAAIAIGVYLLMLKKGDAVG